MRFNFKINPPHQNNVINTLSVFTNSHTFHLLAIEPFNTLDGKVMMLFNKSNTALTVIPISLNGKSKSQIIGYKIKAMIATGQLIISNITHKKKDVINFSEFESLRL